VRRSVEAVIDWLKTHIHRLVDTMRDSVAGVTSEFQEWTHTLVDDIAPGGTSSAPGGAALTAGLAGIRAAFTGKNPAWAAIEGLVSRLSVKAKIAFVLLLILALLLGPVLLVVLLLALIVAVVIAAVRTAAK
jgi:hypothetical protein